MNRYTRHTSGLLSALAIAALMPRCNCDDGGGLSQADVTLHMSFLERDSCSGVDVGRRIPDDYAMTGLAASTDFGSRGERRFEIVQRYERKGELIAEGHFHSAFTLAGKVVAPADVFAAIATAPATQSGTAPEG